MEQIFRPGNDPHIEVEMLLPWYVSDTLSVTEKAAVDTHIAACSDCKTLLAEEFRLREAVASVPLVSASMAQGSHDLQTRLRTPQSLWRRVTSRSAGKTKQVARPLSFMALQAAALASVFFIGFSWQGSNQMGAPNDAEAYRTLSASKAASLGNIIVAAQQGATEADFRLALAEAGAVIVNGPTETGAYVIRVTQNELDSKISALRANRAIALAEPIDGKVQ